MGIDFSDHKIINKIITDPQNNCYVLYPSEMSINLNEHPIGNKSKTTVVFLIDATWPCSRAILTASSNIDVLQKVSFTHTEISKFTFKQQPHDFCLSTIESTLYLLKLLNKHHLESIESKNLNNFLLPFEKMVEYQLSCV